MTVQEAAQAWGINIFTVYGYCTRGLIPGAIRVMENGHQVWKLPDEAKQPLPQAKAQATRRSKTPDFSCIGLPVKVAQRMKYVWTHQNSSTIGEISRVLGVPSNEVIRLYDRAFDMVRKMEA